MVLGHFDIPNKLLMLIYAVHMPLFFFLSGLVYKDSDNALAVRLKKMHKIYYIHTLCWEQ